MGKHTPTPWEARDANVFAGRDCIVICDTDNATPARMRANAALIARAVNCHDELVGALQTLLDAVEGKHVTVGDCNQARAALATATQEG